MLQTKTVEGDTLSLLKDLMSWPLLAEFNLAGGTALALQIGHRTSTGLDFFGKSQIDLDLIKHEVSSTYDFRIEVDSKNIRIGLVNGIKVDFVRYKYNLLESPVEEQGIGILSLPDNGCIKLGNHRTR